MNIHAFSTFATHNVASCQTCSDHVPEITFEDHPTQGENKHVCLECGAKEVQDKPLLLAYAVLKVISFTRAVEIPGRVQG